MSQSNKSKHNYRKLIESIIEISTFILAFLFLFVVAYILAKNTETQPEIPKNEHSIKDVLYLETEDKFELIKHENVAKEEVRELEETQESPKKLKVEATAYTARCRGCIGITKTGYDVTQTVHYEDMRVIAVDPNIIPLHSIVEVTYGNESFKAIALDTGSDIKNDRIDILMKTKARAFDFGRQEVELTILREGKGENS